MIHPGGRDWKPCPLDSAAGVSSGRERTASLLSIASRNSGAQTQYHEVPGLTLSL